MEYLGRLIDFCRENDIQFVAVTTPIPINTLQAYSDNYNAAWKYFGQYFDEHEVTYLNFNTQYFKAFSHDLSDYTDFDGHMNGNAAKEYSKVLANILKIFPRGEKGQYLESSASRYPDKTAFADLDATCTFEELRLRARRVGTALAEHFAPRNPVPVFMEKRDWENL